MASVNFKKMKSVTEVKAVMRHCDREERIATKVHSNDDIQQKVTRKNIQLQRDYKETCKRFDERLAFLDGQPDANKRKDRVVCFGLDIPAPAGMDKADTKDWFVKAYHLVCEQYGKQNVMNMYVHRDEQHEYINAETKEKCMSREHMHVIVVPEHNGKLNGKWFSSRQNMLKLNNTLQKMTESDYNLQFMDGSKTKSRKRVEGLKRRSEALKAEERVKELQDEINALERQKTGLQEQIRVLTEQQKQYSEFPEECTEVFEKFKDGTSADFSKKIKSTQEKVRMKSVRKSLDRASQVDFVERHPEKTDKSLDL